MKLWTKTFFILISFFFIASLPFFSGGTGALKGGLNFLLLVLVIGVILFVIFILSNIKITKKEKEEKETVTRKRIFNSSKLEELKAIFVPLIALLLIIFGLAAIAKWSSSGGYKKPQKVVETPKKATAVKKQVQYGTLSWIKPAGVRGVNPSLRSFSTKAVVHRNDKNAMKFTVIYGEWKSHFEWDRSKKYGEWYQNDPPDSGQWYLLPTNNSKIFVGKISDKSGIFIPLKLELS